VRDFKSTYGFSPALYRSHFKTNGAANGNGHNGNNGNQSSKVRQQLAEVAKHSLLPSVHLFIYVFACLS
jgi:hypothetical protein